MNLLWFLSFMKTPWLTLYYPQNIRKAKCFFKYAVINIGGHRIIGHRTFFALLVFFVLPWSPGPRFCHSYVRARRPATVKPKFILSPSFTYTLIMGQNGTNDLRGFSASSNLASSMGLGCHPGLKSVAKCIGTHA